MQDVVVGFETRLRRIKRNGDRAFGATEGSEDEDDEDASTEHTVSILPVESGEENPASGQSSPDIHQVVIGRSKEEVVAALNRAAEVDPNATPIPEDNTKDAEEVVESLVSDLQRQAVTSAVHEEL